MSENRCPVCGKGDLPPGEAAHYRNLLERRASSPLLVEAVKEIRDEAKWLEAWLGKADSGAYLGCVRRLRALCTKLERGE